MQLHIADKIINIEIKQGNKNSCMFISLVEYQ